LENGKRKYYYTKTKKEALEYSGSSNEQQQGTLATGPQQTLESFLQEWLRLKAINSPS